MGGEMCQVVIFPDQWITIGSHMEGLPDGVRPAKQSFMIRIGRLTPLMFSDQWITTTNVTGFGKTLHKTILKGLFQRIL